MTPPDNAYSKINVARESGVSINVSSGFSKNKESNRLPDDHLFDGDISDHSVDLDYQAAFSVDGGQAGSTGSDQGTVTIDLGQTYTGGMLKIYLPEESSRARTHEGTKYQFRKDGVNVGEEFTLTGVASGYDFYDNNFGVFTFSLTDQSLEFDEVLITFVNNWFLWQWGE